jgi:hypothetical protein
MKLINRPLSAGSLSAGSRALKQSGRVNKKFPKHLINIERERMCKILIVKVHNLHNLRVFKIERGDHVF